MKHCTFDPVGHVYRIHGRPVGGVTTILREAGILRDHSRTDPYYRDRGSAVHEAIRLSLLGRLDDESLDPAITPYLDSAFRAVSFLGLCPLAVEQPMYDPVGMYAGSLDCLGTAEKMGGRACLVDWKTGPLEPGYEVQAAGGYLPLARLAAESGAIPMERTALDAPIVALVSLVNDLPKVHMVDLTEQYNHERLFQAALTTYHWRVQKGALA